MDDIELIIKIPKDYYEILRKNDIIINGLRSGKTFTYVICKAVVNGTPIPKGHGRIIDESQIVGDGSWDFGDRLEETPAIIEADNSESED